MICKKCSHKPHTSRIIFDIGHGQIATYELCTNCQKLDVFSENVSDIEDIEK